MSPRPAPTAIYWRRRLLVVAAVIALVWVGLQLVPSGDDPAPTATPAPDPAAALPAPAAADGPIKVALASDARACDPQKVRVTPSVKPDQVNRGAVQIGLVVSSTEAKPCTLTPSDADLVAIISANDTPIWDSTLCPASLLAEPVQLSAQWATFEITQWSGRVSGSNCSSKQDWAAPGEYTIQVGTLGGEPGKTTFSLGRRPTPKPTTPAPTATPTPSATPTEAG